MRRTVFHRGHLTLVRDLNRPNAQVSASFLQVIFGAYGGQRWRKRAAQKFLAALCRTDAAVSHVRAATEALPHESPRMASVAVGYFTGNDFATRLDRAVEASDRAKLIEGRVIDDQN